MGFRGQAPELSFILALALHIEEAGLTKAARTFAAAGAVLNVAAYDGMTRRRQWRTVAAILALLLTFAAACWVAEVRLDVLSSRIGRLFGYFGDLLRLDTGEPVWTAPDEWFWGLRRWLAALGETLVMAYAGSVLGALAAAALCFPASRNFSRSAVLRQVLRRFLEFSRTVPDIVFALIFVLCFGLGPLPGVLAIAVHTMGTLGKLFSEVVEGIDGKPVEGIVAAGGGWFAQIRFGALPQVLSAFTSYALLRFEINVRSAAVLGFVGAGGIGYTLLIAVRKFYNSDVSAILVLIVATVMLIDYGTEQIRRRLTRQDER